MTFSPAYEAEAADVSSIKPNYYVIFEGFPDIISKHPVIGLATKDHANKLTWTPLRVRIDNAKVSIGSMTITLVDVDDSFITAFQTLDLFQKTMKLFIGFTNLDVAEYNQIAEYKVRDIRARKGVEIQIKATDKLKELDRAMGGQISNSLGADITDAATTLSLNDSTGFPVTGTIFIDQEAMTYTNVSGNDLTGLTRGALGTTADEHDAGTDVVIFKTFDENPITGFLQLLISPGGGGVYDVLDIGMGIPEADIDVSQFEEVRDNTTLAGQTYRFEFNRIIDNFLDYMEDEILLPTNIRVFTRDEGQIGIAVFDRIILSEAGNVIDKSDIFGVPDVIGRSERLANRVTFDFDFDLATDKYKKTITFNNTDSQTRFGLSVGKKFKFKNIKASLDGTFIITELASLYFRRNAFPEFQFSKLSVDWAKQFFQSGDRVLITHEDIHDFINGNRGVTNKAIEIISKKWNLDTGKVQYDVDASEFIDNKFAFISPASRINTRNSDTQVTLLSAEGSKWEVGDVVELWDFITMTKLNDGLIILTVATDVITFTTTISAFNTNEAFIRYEQFSNIVSNQARFGFANDRGNDLPGPSEPYLIV